MSSYYVQTGLFRKISSYLMVMGCFFLFCNVVNAQSKGDFNSEDIQQNIQEQLALYPQEKIHLHLDRDMYVPGEKIWFKAYLVDASSHVALTASRYVYVELVSPDSLISRVMIRPENDLYYGHIPITEVLPEGDYTIRAYTRYMENMGEEYFFTKNIRIGKIETGKEPSDSREKKNMAKTQKEDYDVSFFPEGGNLLAGTVCNIGFKALNNKGLSESVSGRILDEKDSLILSVSTFYAGMGRFAFIPEEGRKYVLECTNGEGMTKRFALPDAYTNAYSLASTLRDGKLYVYLKKTAGIPDKPFYVLLHNKGDVLYFGLWGQERNFLAFDKTDLPAGIIQIVLFDNQLNPLSERLVFCKKEEPVDVRFQTDRESYGTRDKVSSLLSIKGLKGEFLPSSLSVSITDDKDVSVDEAVTILSTLLLSSEIKGHVEAPGYYFANDDIQADMALDNLMLTQGWRRYNIPEVVKGNMETPQIPFESSQSINGTVKTLFLSKPIEGGQVSLFTNSGDFGLVETDEKGFFSFSDFEFPDSTTYFIQSVNKKGGGRVDMVLDERAFPAAKYIHKQDIPYRNEIVGEENAAETDFMEKAAQRSKYDENMRVIHLQGVEVVASIIKKEDKDLPWYAKSADAAITRENFEKMNFLHVRDLLSMVSGVQVFPDGSILIRGIGSLASDTSPLVLIDGFEGTLEDITIHEVERVDVFKGASAALWGVRGGNGVISVTTRRGSSDYTGPEPLNRKALSPLGYQKPVEFYSPKYETPESKHLGNPDYRTTIFWKPDLVTSEGEEASFEFYTSDFHTTYSVVIEGLTTEGHIIRKVEKIKVE